MFELSGALRRAQKFAEVMVVEHQVAAGCL